MAKVFYNGGGDVCAFGYLITGDGAEIPPGPVLDKLMGNSHFHVEGGEVEPSNEYETLSLDDLKELATERGIAFDGRASAKSLAKKLNEADGDAE